jgi:hypothetical protein
MHGQTLIKFTKRGIIYTKTETRVNVTGKENQIVNSQSFHSSESCVDQMSTGLNETELFCLCSSNPLWIKWNKLESLKAPSF